MIRNPVSNPDFIGESETEALLPVSGLRPLPPLPPLPSACLAFLISVCYRCRASAAATVIPSSLFAQCFPLHQVHPAPLNRQKVAQEKVTHQFHTNDFLSDSSLGVRCPSSALCSVTWPTDSELTRIQWIPPRERKAGASVCGFVVLALCTWLLLAFISNLLFK
jgi:hypothetical protein